MFRDIYLYWLELLTCFPLWMRSFPQLFVSSKKIVIDRFGDVSETKDCIVKPLVKLGLKPQELLAQSELALILLCLQLFVKYMTFLEGGHMNPTYLPFPISKDAGRTKHSDGSQSPSFRRGTSKIETSQDFLSRPLLHEIQSLSKEELKAFSLLSASNERTTFEQLWTLEYIISGNTNWRRQDLERIYRELIEKGVLQTNEEGKIVFPGDEFDKIYTRYYVREQTLSLYMDFPFEIFRDFQLSMLFQEVGGFQKLTSYTVNQRK